MYLINNYNSLIQLSALLWQLHSDFNGNTKYLFPVSKSNIQDIGLMQIEDFNIKFTQDKTAEIKQLTLAMEPDLTENEVDMKVAYLIANEEVSFLTLLENLNINIRDKQYLLDNGFISEQIYI